jgi:hypothetical protein
MGLVINEFLYNLFPNIINNVKINEFKKKYNDFSYDEQSNMGISYNTLLCYFIIAFQEAYKKQQDFNNKIIQSLKDQDDNILNLVKMKKSE